MITNPRLKLQSRLIHWLTCLVISIGVTTLHAASITWDAGEAPVTNWMTSTFQNWSGDVTPAGNDVTFTATGSTTSSSTVTNTVNQNVSINSLTYGYNSATNYQVTEILTGATLSVGGATNVFTVGLNQAGVTTTKAVIKGAGALNVSQSGGVVVLGNINFGSNVVSSTVFDMGDLATFSASLGSTGSFLVGSNPTTASAAQGSASTVTLADTNTITAGTFAVGSASTNNQVSTDGPTTLYLGRSNTINATTVYVGHGAASTVNGTMKFDPDVLASSPTATFRGTAGTSTAVTTFYVGVNTTNSSASQTGVVDFTGGSVDAIITTLLVGGSITNFPTAKAQGTLSMDAGTITATTTGIGQASGLSATSTTFGILNVAGGTFSTTNLLLANHNYGAASTAPVTGTVNISGTGAVTVSSASGIVMGQHTNAANSAAVTAAINITGGSLTVSGNIAEGTNPTGVTSSLNLDGGTLEMNSKAISVDTFTAASGTLRNLGQLNSGGTFTKTTSGTLILAGTNTYTGSTAINGGTLLVSGTHTGGGSYSINNLGTLSGSGTITTAGNAGVSLLAGGKLAPGSTSSGLKLDLGTGSLDISGGVTSAASQSLLFTLGTVSDKISMTNASSVLNIGSGVLNFDDFVFSQGTGFAAGDYTLFDTGNTIVGTLGSNLTGTVGGFGATLHFGNSNQDVIITLAVPEPSQMAFLCMSGVCFLVWRSRRKLATRLAVKFQDS